MKTSKEEEERTKMRLRMLLVCLVRIWIWKQKQLEMIDTTQLNRTDWNRHSSVFYRIFSLLLASILSISISHSYQYLTRRNSCKSEHQAEQEAAAEESNSVIVSFVDRIRLNERERERNKWTIDRLWFTIHRCVMRHVRWKMC